MSGNRGDLIERFVEVVGADHVLAGHAIKDDYAHDESLTVTPERPLAVERHEA